MIDGSHHPYNKNVELTKQVVEYAHRFDVTVEGELGVLAGIEDEVSSAVTNYTKPEEVEDFVKKTGVDSLAISIGTSHGANKFNRSNARALPTAFFFPRRCVSIFSKRWKKEFRVSRSFCTALLRFPVELIKIIKQQRRQIERCSRYSRRSTPQSCSICSLQDQYRFRRSIGYDGSNPQIFVDSPAEFDPRKYLGPARDQLKALYKHKVTSVLGSNDKA